jgi:transposase
VISVSENINDLAISDYLNSKESLSVVASKYGLTGGWLQKSLKSKGIERRGKSDWKVNEINQANACLDYNNGMEVLQIANKYFVSRRTISDWLKKNGIKPLTYSERLGITNDMKIKARVMYSESNMNCVDISKSLNVSCRSILDWVKDIKRTKSEVSVLMAIEGKKKTRGVQGYVETRFGKIRHDSSYERDRIIQLNTNDNVQSISRCDFFIKYDHRNYNPDFNVTYKCGCVCVEEVKPLYMIKDETNLLKFRSAINYLKDKKILFKVVTEKEIYGK